MSSSVTHRKPQREQPEQTDPPREQPREKPPEHEHEHDRGCCPVPQFERLNYFYGQMLGVQDFKAEQDYFREKMRLHNRCLHGWGVVCGLEVRSVVQPRGCDPCEQEVERPTLRIECGIALDCLGNELVVRAPMTVDLLEALAPDPCDDPPRPHGHPSEHDDDDGDDVRAEECPPGEREQGREDVRERSLWLSLCFHEQGVCRTRPVVPDGCGSTSACTWSRLRDSVCVHVSDQEPKQEERCEGCCSCCDEDCVVLARIDHVRPGRPVRPQDIHMEVRRPLTTYHSARVESVNWEHGATYDYKVASDILDGGELHPGLVIRFTREVLSRTLQPGVIDVFWLTGGGPVQGGVQHLAGDIAVPPGETTRELHFRIRGHERLSKGDRVLIVLRTAFVLDTCCRPVDGEHIGGWVPVLPDHADLRPTRPHPSALDHCRAHAGRVGGLASGNGVPAGNFESWFFIE